MTGAHGGTIAGICSLVVHLARPWIRVPTASLLAYLHTGEAYAQEGIPAQLYRTPGYAPPGSEGVGDRLACPDAGDPLVGPVTAVAGCGETGDPQPRHRLVMAP